MVNLRGGMWGGRGWRRRVKKESRRMPWFLV